MPLETLGSYLDEFEKRENQPEFDSRAFTNDFIRGVSISGRNRTQPFSKQEAESKGFLRQTGEAIGGGFTDSAELWMRAIRTLDPKGGNDVIRDFATGGLSAIKNFVAKHPSLSPDANVEEGVKRWWAEGVRSFIPSLSASLPGVLAGTAIAVGTGGAGAPVGAAIGSTFGGAIFALAEHDRFKEEVEDFITQNKLSEEAATDLREQAASKAIFSAITEGGLEGAANLLETLSLGLFRPLRAPVKAIAGKPIRQLFKKSASQLAKETAVRLPRTAAIEVGTEASQEALETKFRRDIGLTDISSMDAAMSVVGPSLVTTLLFFGAAGGANSLHRRAIQKALQDAGQSESKRRKAVKEISDIVRATGQPESEQLAEQILSSGERFINEGLSIDLNTEVGVQNALGEIVKGLRTGDLDLEKTQKYENKLAEALRADEGLTNQERISKTQLLQGIANINRVFEANPERLGTERKKKKPLSKKPVTSSDRLRNIGQAATVKGKTVESIEQVEVSENTPQNLRDIGKEAAQPGGQDIAKVEREEIAKASDEQLESELKNLRKTFPTGFPELEAIQQERIDAINTELGQREGGVKVQEERKAEREKINKPDIETRVKALANEIEKEKTAEKPPTEEDIARIEKERAALADDIKKSGIDTEEKFQEFLDSIDVQPKDINITPEETRIEKAPGEATKPETPETPETPKTGAGVNFAERLVELSGGKISIEAADKSAKALRQVIETGEYNDIVHPENKFSRKLFEEITGKKLPGGVQATKDFFKKPEEFTKAEPVVLPEKPIINKFFIQKPDSTFEEINGKQVLKDLGDFFIHKSEDGNWIITEGRSGLRVHVGFGRRKDAIDEAREILKESDKDKLQGLIKDGIKDSGLSPRFGGVQIAQPEEKLPNKEESRKPSGVMTKAQQSEFIKLRNEKGFALIRGDKEATEKAEQDIQAFLEENNLEDPREAKEDIGATPENSDKLANNIALRINPTGQPSKEFSKATLFKMADEAFGGTRSEGIYNSKDAFDALELGINKLIASGKMGRLGPDSPITVEIAKGLEKDISDFISNVIPSQQGLRSEEQDEFQQFSTPPEIAFAMTYLANTQEGDVVLEPSAGTGGIAAFASASGVKVVMNELSDRRANLLEKLDIGRVFRENAEQLDNILPKNIKPTVILTNPPFSATAGRIKGQRKSANVIQHLEQDLNRLEPQGRMVAIIGEGPFGISDKVNNWLQNLKNKGHSFTADISIDGKKYKKYGTTFGIKILVIDKEVKQIVDTREIKIGPDEPIINEQLEVIRNDRQGELREVGAGVEQERPEPTGGEIIDEGGKPGVIVSGSDRPVHLPSDVVGDQEWDSRIGGEPVTKTGGSRDLPIVPVEPEEGTELSNEERGRERDVSITGPKASERSAGRSETATGLTGRPSERRLGDTEPGLSERSGEIEVEKAIEPFEETSIEVISEERKQNREELTDSIFDDYKPQKLKIKGAKKHPSPLVQSAAMAAVVPPDPTYSPKLPKKLIESGDLSRAQLEAIVYAGQAHEQLLTNGTRRGFFIGDGPGVGKGRTIAGIIMDNMARGRKKAVWISANTSLVNDAIRDWTALGGDRKKVMNLSTFKADQEIKAVDGLLFTTFSTLASGRRVDPSGEKSTGKPDIKNRIDQIKKWLGEDFDGAIIYDEAHQAANALPQSGARGTKAASLRGLAAVDFQTELPNARFTYASATGATQVAHFAYAERLGLWGEGTAFPNKQAFISEIKNSGIAGMEVIARDMKAQGMYIARSLSYNGVTYERLTHKLTDDQKKTFDVLANAWQTILQNLGAALEATGATQRGGSRARSNAMAQFWGAELRFFNQVILSLQMPTALSQMETQLKAGNAVVIQLVNTNESIQERQLSKMAAEGDEDFVDLTPRQNMIQYLENAFPTQQMEQFEDENGNIRMRPVFSANGDPVQNRQAVELKERMLDEVGAVKVPEGPLEQIINTFGHDKVAEVTGRKRRQVRINGKPVIQPRSKARSEREVDAFQNDKIQVLVFSDAGGTGRSYHADRGIKNQRKRIHYVLQPGFKADAAVQGMGRSHRSNQATEPHYVLVTTDVEGQKRFLSAIARVLDQLGALTKGQRQTGGQGLFNAKDNLQSKYSTDALTNFFIDLYDNDIIGMNFEQVTSTMGLNNLIGENGEFLMNNLPNINRFLNRILALPLSFQNQIFNAFHNRLSRIIDRAIANGTFETGMQNFKAFSIKIKQAQTVYKKEGIETQYIQFEAKHKIKFTEFDAVVEKHKDGKGAFWMNKQSGHIWSVSNFGTRTLRTGEVIDEVLLESPVTHNYRVEDARTVNEKNWIKNTGTVTNPKFVRNNETIDGKEWWNQQIKNNKGFRTENIHLISGALLPIWDRLPKTGETTVPMKVIRIQTDEGERFIGRQIASGQVQSTLANLGASVDAQQFNIPDVISQIRDSKAVAKLANGWRIMIKRVAGEERIELVGNDVYTAIDELRRNGLFTERIQFETRFFIPSGEQADQVIANITKNRPIVDVLLPQQPGSDAVAAATKRIANTGINMGMDPTIIKDMAVVGMHHFKRGLKTFAEWSKAMIKDLGERVRQFLRQVWRNVRTQGQVIDGETAFEAEQASFAKEEHKDDEIQRERISQNKEVNEAKTGIEDVDDIINKFTTHNPYNVLYNGSEKNRIDELFSDSKDEDIGFWSRITSLPWWKAKRFPEWKKALGIEIKRQEDKNLLKLEFGSKVFDKGGKDKQHEMFALSDKSADRVIKVIYEGDARNIEFTNKQLTQGVTLDELGIQYDELKGITIKLNPDEIKAYRSFQISMRKARNKVVETMEELIYRPYQGKEWVDDLKKLVKDKEAARFSYNSSLGLVEDREEVSPESELSEADIPQNLNDADRAAFIAAFNRVFKPQINIENLRRRMGKIKGYAPRIRPEGTFKIDIFDKNGKQTWSEIVPNEREGKKRVRQLIAREQGRGKKLDEDFTITVKQVKKTPEFLYQQVSVTAIERFMQKAVNRLETKADITQEELDTIRESMTEALTDELKERGFGAHMMKRRRGRAIGGYEITGGKKIFAGYIGGMAGFITKQKAAYEHGQLLSTIDVSKKPRLYEEISIYSRNLLRNQTRADLVSSRIRTAAFLWYLSGQLKSPAVNFTQNWILGIPTLGKFTTGARRKYNKAFFDVARRNFSEEEKSALTEAAERGITGDQLMQDIFGETLSQAGKAYSTVLKILSFPFSASEIFNRKAAFLARFRAGLEKGESRKIAFNAARDFVFDVHFLYGKENQALIASGGTPFNNVVRTSLTFRNYTFNYLNALKFHIGDANLMLVGRSLAYLAILGGLSSLPFLDDWLDMFERLTGVAIRKGIQKELKGIGGDILAEVGTFGLPALVGVDLSGSLRIKFPDITDPGQLFQDTAFGVYGGLATKGLDMIKAISSGETLRAIESGSPTFIEKPLKALRLFKEGGVTRTGKTIFTGSGRPLKITEREALTQALGFRPSRLAFESGKFRQFTNIEQFFKERRTGIFRKLRFAKTSSERRKVFQAIREYNKEARKQKGVVPLITTSTIKRAQQEKPSKRFRAFSR